MTDPADILEGLPPHRDDEPAALRQDIADELADHLRCASDREGAWGGDDEDAVSERVVERFGDPVGVAQQLWWDAMKERIMRDRVLMVGVAVLTVLCGLMAFATWSMVSQQQRVAEAMLARLGQATPPASLEWGKLTVRLLDAQGKPMRDRPVQIEGKLFDADERITRKQPTPANGEVVFGPIRTGAQYMLKVEGLNGFVYGGRADVIPPGQDKEVTLRHPPVAEPVVVRATIAWPEDLRDAGLITLLELLPKDDDQEEHGWWLPGLTFAVDRDGAAADTIESLQLTSASRIDGVAVGMMFARLRPSSSPNDPAPATATPATYRLSHARVVVPAGDLEQLAQFDHAQVGEMTWSDRPTLRFVAQPGATADWVFTPPPELVAQVRASLRTLQQAREAAKADPAPAAVLAFAEPRLREQYPEAYEKHKPFVARHQRASNVWDVVPASGVKSGAPSMSVSGQEEFTIVDLRVAP